MTKTKQPANWEDVVFEIDLLKSQEINLDYILGLIFGEAQQAKQKQSVTDGRGPEADTFAGNRAKEELVVDFIQQTNLDEMPDKAGIIDAFFAFCTSASSGVGRGADKGGKPERRGGETLYPQLLKA